MERHSQTFEETPNPRKPALSVRQERLLHMIAEGRTIASAARATGTSRWHASTLVNRREFQDELQAVLERARYELMRRLPAMTVEALRVLDESLMSSRAEVRIAAAREILRVGIPLLAMVEQHDAECLEPTSNAGGAAEE